jgi:hypothetical protein
LTALLTPSLVPLPGIDIDGDIDEIPSGRYWNSYSVPDRTPPPTEEVSEDTY